MAKYILIFISTLTLIKVSAVHSEVFCATDSDSLQLALILAGLNEQSDLIKVAEGSYPTILAGFTYQSTSNFDLEISGGWTEFFGNDCGQQLVAWPFSTTLSGHDEDRVLKIDTGSGGADFKVSSFIFLSGFVEGADARGGGLYFATSPGYFGDIRVERNAFLANTAEFGGALSISRGDRITIRNNIFSTNHSESGSESSAIEITQTDATGLYFTNNTVVSNTTDSLEPLNSSAAWFFIDGTSQAFIANNVFWLNDHNDLWMFGSGFKFLYNNDIVGSQLGVPDVASGNISEEPLFVPGFGFTPSLNSPLVNAGVNSPRFVPIPTPFELNWSLGSVDVIGNIRKQDGTVDIGAYESLPEIPIFINGFE